MASLYFWMKNELALTVGSLAKSFGKERSMNSNNSVTLLLCSCVVLQYPGHHYSVSVNYWMCGYWANAPEFHIMIETSTMCIRCGKMFNPVSPHSAALITYTSRNTWIQWEGENELISCVPTAFCHQELDEGKIHSQGPLWTFLGRKGLLPTTLPVLSLDCLSCILK